MGASRLTWEASTRRISAVVVASGLVSEARSNLVSTVIRCASGTSAAEPTAISKTSCPS